jgi:hypothetical protein
VGGACANESMQGCVRGASTTYHIAPSRANRTLNIVEQKSVNFVNACLRKSPKKGRN